MRIKKAGGKIFGAVLSAAEKKAMDMEINRQIVEADRRYAEHDRLIQYYQMPDDYTWLCKEMLKRIGVDVEAWNHERREPNEAEKH